MNGIGGNTMGTLQAAEIAQNAIGESVETWQDVQKLNGWLDLSGGSSSYTAYASKVQESTHVFVADWVEIDERVKSGRARMLIEGEAYDVMLFDNPMNMKSGSHWEIFLKYVK